MNVTLLCGIAAIGIGTLGLVVGQLGVRDESGLFWYVLFIIAGCVLVGIGI